MVNRVRKGVYRSERSNKQVRRKYIGTLNDPVVRGLETAWHLQSVEAEYTQVAVEAEIEIVSAAQGALKLLAAEANRAMRALRKRFRRRRRRKMVRAASAAPLPVQEEYDEIVAGAAQGSEECLEELRQILAEHPTLYRTLGDLSRHVRKQLIEHAAGPHVDMQEALEMMLTAKEHELLEDGSSLIEQMLVDQVLITLVDAAYCQVGYLQPHGTEKIKDRWRRHLGKAQQRHQAALKSLIEARKMISRPRASAF